LLLALMFCVTVYIILRFLRRKTEWQQGWTMREEGLIIYLTLR
jgi:hypothetical protein